MNFTDTKHVYVKYRNAKGQVMCHNSICDTETFLKENLSTEFFELYTQMRNYIDEYGCATPQYPIELDFLSALLNVNLQNIDLKTLNPGYDYSVVTSIQTERYIRLKAATTIIQSYQQHNCDEHQRDEQYEHKFNHKCILEQCLKDDQYRVDYAIDCNMIEKIEFPIKLQTLQHRLRVYNTFPHINPDDMIVRPNRISKTLITTTAAEKIASVMNNDKIKAFFTQTNELVTRYNQLAKQFEIRDTAIQAQNNTFVKLHTGKKIIYVAKIGFYNNAELIKIGRSDDIENRVNQHTNDFEVFQLVEVYATYFNVEVEKRFKQTHKTKRRKVTINGKVQSELFVITPLWNIKEVMQSFQLIDRQVHKEINNDTTYANSVKLQQLELQLQQISLNETSNLTSLPKDTDTKDTAANEKEELQLPHASNQPKATKNRRSSIDFMQLSYRQS